MNKPKIKLGISKNDVLQTIEKMDGDFYSLNKLNELLKEIVENNVFFLFVELLKKISCDYHDKGLLFDKLKEQYLSYFQQNLKNSNIYCEILSLNLKNIEFDQLNLDSTNKSQNLSPATIKNKMDKTPDQPAMNSETDERITEPIETITDKVNINENKCYARTASNSQCSRKKQQGFEFCGSHIHSQPYGRIDQQCVIDHLPKKRGRPPISHQNSNNKPCSQTDNAINIEATIEIIDGIQYIIDNSTQNIYKIDEPIIQDPGEINCVNMDNLKLVGKKLENDKVIWYSNNDLKFIKK